MTSRATNMIRAQFATVDVKVHRWTLIEGESLRVLRALPSASVDAVITDPPYSSGGAFRGDRMMQPSTKYESHDVKLERPEFTGDNRDQRSFAYWCALWLSEALRVAKVGAPIVCFTDWRQLPSVTDAIQAGGWIWRGIVPWDKTTRCRPQKGRFAAQAEYVIWGSNGPFPTERGVGCLPGVITHCADIEEKRHLAGKPIPVMRELNKICEPGGLILDPFAGSGATGVAAIRDGYRFVGIERSAEYAKVARTWLEAEENQSTYDAKENGQRALFEVG